MNATANKKEKNKKGKNDKDRDYIEVRSMVVIWNFLTMVTQSAILCMRMISAWCMNASMRTCAHKQKSKSRISKLNHTYITIYIYNTYYISIYVHTSLMFILSISLQMV